MYEPSKELIEQIGGEFQNSKPEWGIADASARHVVSTWCNLPTIRKALELYENQPQWQDNPDKEGWYGVSVKGEGGRWHWLYPPSDAVGVVKQKGAIHLAAEDEDYTLSEFLKRYNDYDGIKFLYLPEPEPYKEGK